MKKLAYIETYKTVVKELALQFSKHYFDSSDIEVLWNESVGIWPIDCHQYVFDIDDIICALYNDIPFRILIDRYEFRSDQTNIKYNLYSYFKNQW